MFAPKVLLLTVAALSLFVCSASANERAEREREPRLQRRLWLRQGAHSRILDIDYSPNTDVRDLEIKSSAFDLLKRNSTTALLKYQKEALQLSVKTMHRL